MGAFIRQTYTPSCVSERAITLCFVNTICRKRSTIACESDCFGDESKIIRGSTIFTRRDVMEARGAGGGSLGVFGDRAVILECIVAAESLVSGKGKGESGLDDVSDVGDSGKPAAKKEIRENSGSREKISTGLSIVTITIA